MSARSEAWKRTEKFSQRSAVSSLFLYSDVFARLLFFSMQLRQARRHHVELRKQIFFWCENNNKANAFWNVQRKEIINVFGRIWWKFYWQFKIIFVSKIWRDLWLMFSKIDIFKLWNHVMNENSMRENVKPEQIIFWKKNIF